MRVVGKPLAAPIWLKGRGSGSRRGSGSGQRRAVVTLKGLEVSSYYLANEARVMCEGLDVATDPQDWTPFQIMSPESLAKELVGLARNVRLPAFKRHKRGPKKPVPKLRHPLNFCRKFQARRSRPARSALCSPQARSRSRSRSPLPMPPAGSGEGGGRGRRERAAGAAQKAPENEGIPRSGRILSPVARFRGVCAKSAHRTTLPRAEAMEISSWARPPRSGLRGSHPSSRS